MKIWFCFILIVVLLLLDPMVSSAVTVSMSSGTGSDIVRSSDSYNLDRTTELTGQSILAGGAIDQVRSIRGEGPNSLASSIDNGKLSVTSKIKSTNGLCSALSSSASGDLVALGQKAIAMGESEVSVSGSSGSSSSSLESGVLDGALALSHGVSVKDDGISSVQSAKIIGELGYSAGKAQSPGGEVQVNAGLNGIGMLDSQMSTSTLEGIKASSAVQADSLTSKAYSTGRAVSSDADVYSYLSSSSQLYSEVNAKAGEQVSTSQNLNTAGDVLVYASTQDSSSSVSYASEGQDASGRLSADSGSSQTITSDLAGNIKDKPGSLAPVAGNYIWQSEGGYIISNPDLIVDNQGRLHAFAAGGDHALWDNINGDWVGLGGYISSDPYAVKDLQGRLHILARGADNGLWDNIFNTALGTAGWHGLGGYLTSNPSAVVNPSSGILDISVRGGDNALWLRNLNPSSLSGGWQSGGGYITSNPNMIYDNLGNFHVFARGSDGSLWDKRYVNQGNGNFIGQWTSLGGYTTSDAKPVISPGSANQINVYTRGGDGGLWGRTLNTQTLSGTWYASGGFFNGNPEPIVDAANNLNILVRGGDGSMWDRYLTPTSEQWYNLGGYITSNPSAARSGSALYFDARGGDGALWNVYAG